MEKTALRKLVCYGKEKGFFEDRDEIYITNLLAGALCIDEITDFENYENVNLEETLGELLDYAVKSGIIEDSVTARDLFDTKLMGIMLPRPSEVTKTFWEKYEQSPREATEYYYELSKNSDYIRTYRVAKDKKWTYASKYGELDITINLSKPEKDPKAILAAKTAPQSGYPKCLLCKECEGYAGRGNFPARQNHRVIPVKINGKDWFWQYSPYVYYNEHCIVFDGEHIPMEMNGTTFKKLFDFIKLFPHYFIGSNAGLPIVGGSILSHSHFQGGRYTFAMAKAAIETPIKIAGFEDVTAGILKWPMSVIRLCGTDSERIIELGTKVLEKWENYTDETVGIFAETEGEKHNTVTPIARKIAGVYQLDLVLRNNITSAEHPLGVFHPHEELQHIKKENIGLIEVMGLAVLPARLKGEMEALKTALLENRDIYADQTLNIHADWANEIKQKYNLTSENIDGIIEKEIGTVFEKVLECAGVFKRDEDGKAAFLRFADTLNG